MILLSIYLGVPVWASSNLNRPFQANLNVTLSNISGSIAASRTSCLTPCFIQVSGSAITATGTSRPYEDVEYAWNFGDASGNEIFIHPITGAAVNANSYQIGAEAAYVYRTAGTYRVMLIARGRSGGGNSPSTASYITATFTQDITVTDFRPSTDLYFDSANGSDSNNGTSPAAPKQTFAAIRRAISSIGNNTRLNFARGSNWTDSTGMDFRGKTLSGIRIAAYGSGATPIITINGAGACFSTSNGGGSTPHPQDDFVISDLSCQTATGYASTSDGYFIGVNMGNASATETNFYFDNVTANVSIDPPSNNAKPFGMSSPANLKYKWGWWNCTSATPISSEPNNHAGGIYLGIANWTFFMFGNVSGGGTNNTFDHQIYHHGQYHGLFSYNLFGPTVTSGAPTKNYAIKTSYDPSANDGDGTFYARFFVRSNNYITGSARAYDEGSNNANVITNSRYKDNVTEQNAIANTKGANTITVETVETLTERYNRAWGNAGVYFDPSNSIGFLSAYIYGNQIYTTSQYTSANSAEVFFYEGGGAWTTPQVITDNIVWGTGSAANLNDFIFGDAHTAGWTVDRNNYWAPSTTDFLYNNTKAVSLATWQAGSGGSLWDNTANTVTNSNNAQPAWSVPPTTWGSFGP